ncbi:hypothetical protein ILYODFUR_033734 [Ilyodon furcidens]|uniref:Uncharacterized protein n=1 Tax=Ilyodon furcidens TaxID=33524 RepID=A0ABV0TSR4_9TELE
MVVQPALTQDSGLCCWLLVSQKQRGLGTVDLYVLRQSNAHILIKIPPLPTPGEKEEQVRCDWSNGSGFQLPGSMLFSLWFCSRTGLVEKAIFLSTVSDCTGHAQNSRDI